MLEGERGGGISSSDSLTHVHLIYMYMYGVNLVKVISMEHPLQQDFHDKGLCMYLVLLQGVSKLFTLTVCT